MHGREAPDLERRRIGEIEQPVFGVVDGGLARDRERRAPGRKPGWKRWTEGPAIPRERVLALPGRILPGDIPRFERCVSELLIFRR